MPCWANSNVRCSYGESKQAVNLRPQLCGNDMQLRADLINHRYGTGLARVLREWFLCPYGDYKRKSRIVSGGVREM